MNGHVRLGILLSFLLSGMMFIVLAWRAKNGRMPALHYLIAAAPIILFLALYHAIQVWLTLNAGIQVYGERGP